MKIGYSLVRDTDTIRSILIVEQASSLPIAAGIVEQASSLLITAGIVEQASCLPIAAGLVEEASSLLVSQGIVSGRKRRLEVSSAVMSAFRGINF